ncbi:MAG: bifunctional nuclease family protein [Saprospiraceae bacterium]|jgi:bifunctional DNase/RNase|nr:bifunctional nuclease family protein [Saprospiraceae bacterium]
MKKIELEIVTLSHSISQSHNYAVVLGEVDGSRKLPIVIGSFEAQAIAVAMEKMNPNRPLTHDLFKNALDTFDIEIKEVVINNLLDGIFYARLVCVKNGETVEIDSRTSDAVAMAVRANCPIYTFDFILESAGVVLEESEDRSAAPASQPARKERHGGAFNQYSIEALNKMLEDVLAEEDYERAAKIRDEINKRKERNQ